MSRSYFYLATSLFLCAAMMVQLAAQDKIITVPKPVSGVPFKVSDDQQLFGKAYRWFLEGETEWAADSLRKLISLSGFQLNENNYNVVVADYGDQMSPIGVLHNGSSFLDTRLYGLTTDKLYYIFISTDENAPSFLSTTLTLKASPFDENLVDFIGLFPVLGSVDISDASEEVWIDVREYSIPEKFRKNCDISIIVKRDIKAERNLAGIILDNTAKEKWSFGIATAITSLNDVRFVTEDGRIVIEPIPWGDFAVFGVLNYHFKAVDTKAPDVSGFHLIGGLRIADFFEPIMGIGYGLPLSLGIQLHLFAGGSLAFRNELKSGFSVLQEIDREVDPFDTKLKVMPRYGIEVRFP